MDLCVGGAEAARAEKEGDEKEIKEKRSLPSVYCINTSFLFKTVKENKIKQDNGAAAGGLGLPLPYRQRD